MQKDQNGNPLMFGRNPGTIYCKLVIQILTKQFS